jgi:hypothetical protein
MRLEKMKNKLLSLAFTAIIFSNITLVGCGSDMPETIPEIAGYTDNQLQMPVQQAPQVQTYQTPATRTPVQANKTTKQTAPTTTAKGKQPVAPIVPAASAQSGLSSAQKLILKAKQTYDSYTNFKSTISMFTVKNEKTAPKSSPVANAEFKYTFQPPRLSQFYVVKHSVSIAIGATMVWKGGDSVKARGAGALGLVPMEIKLNDSKLTTNRNWRLDQLDHIGILSRALDKRAKLTLAGKSTINGKEAYMIRVEGTGLDDEITEENIAIDTRTFTILADEMYAGKKLVFQTKMAVEEINLSLPANTFEI